MSKKNNKKAQSNKSKMTPLHPGIVKYIDDIITINGVKYAKVPSKFIKGKAANPRTLETVDADTVYIKQGNDGRWYRTRVDQDADLINYLNQNGSEVSTYGEGPASNPYNPKDQFLQERFKQQFWNDGGRDIWLKEADARAKTLTPTLGTFATLALKPIEAALPSNVVGTIGKQVRNFDLSRLPSDWLGSGFGGGNLGFTEVSDATANWAEKNPEANSAINFVGDMLLAPPVSKAVGEAFKVVSPSTYIPGKAGKVADVALWGGMAYPSIQEAVKNPNSGNIIVATANSIPAVVSGYNAFKALNNGRLAIGNYLLTNGKYVSGVKIGNKAYGFGKDGNPYYLGIIADNKPSVPTGGTIANGGDLQTGDLVRLENGKVARISDIGKNSVTITTQGGNKFNMSKVGASELKIEKPQLEKGDVIFHIRQNKDNSTTIDEYVYTGKQDEFGGIEVQNKYGENQAVTYDDLHNGNFEIQPGLKGDIQPSLPEKFGQTIRQEFGRVRDSLRRGLRRGTRRTEIVEEPVQPVEPTIEIVDKPSTEPVVQSTIPVEQPAQKPVNSPSSEPTLEIVQEGTPQQGAIINQPVNEVAQIQQEIYDLKYQRAQLVNARKVNRNSVHETMEITPNNEVRIVDQKAYDTLKAEDEALVQEISKINDRLEQLGEERFGQNYNDGDPDEIIPEKFLPKDITSETSIPLQPQQSSGTSPEVPATPQKPIDATVQNPVYGGISEPTIPVEPITQESTLQPATQIEVQDGGYSIEVPTDVYSNTQVTTSIETANNTYPQFDFEGKTYYKVLETPEGDPVLVEKGTNRKITRDKDIFNQRAIALDSNGEANVPLRDKYVRPDGVEVRVTSLEGNGQIKVLNTKTGKEEVQNALDFLRAKRESELSKVQNQNNNSLTNTTNEVPQGQQKPNEQVTNNQTPNEQAVNSSSDDTEDLLAAGIFKEGVQQGGNNSNITASRRWPKLFSPVYGKIRIGQTEYITLGDNNGVLQLQDPKNGKVFSTTMEELLNGKKKVEVINTGFNLFSFGPGASSKFNVNGDYVYLPGTKFKDFGLFTGSYSPYRRFSFAQDVAKPFAKAFWLPGLMGGSYIIDSEYPQVMPNFLTPWKWDLGLKSLGTESDEGNPLDNTKSSDSTIVTNGVADESDIAKINDNSDIDIDNVATNTDTNPEKTREVNVDNQATANDDDDLGEDYSNPTQFTQGTGNQIDEARKLRIQAKKDTIEAVTKVANLLENIDSQPEYLKGPLKEIKGLNGRERYSKMYDFYHYYLKNR